MNDDDSDDDDEVGYCKPPKHTRFKPGKSGNPRGRPKGRVDIATLAARAMNVTVRVTEKGKTTMRSKLEIGLLHQANKAAGGDIKALNLMLSLTAPASAGDAPGDTPDLIESRRIAREFFEQLLDGSNHNDLESEA